MPLATQAVITHVDELITAIEKGFEEVRKTLPYVFDIVILAGLYGGPCTTLDQRPRL